jgi:hypothetical protein
LAGETEVVGENLPRRHFVHHKSHLQYPGANPGCRSGKPATNRFSYAAAYAGQLLTRPDETQNNDDRDAISKLLPHHFRSRPRRATARIRAPQNGWYLSITKLNIFASRENVVHSNP